jgi:hypothetical protein
MDKSTFSNEKSSPLEQPVFTLALITEGATEKVFMRLKSIYSKNFGFIESKNILKKKLYNDITFGIKISSVYLFRAASIGFFVLNKNVLFHY